MCHSGGPAWKRLIVDQHLTSEERISLITDIFSDRDETEMVKHLRGDDAQSFVDVVYQVIPPLIFKQNLVYVEQVLDSLEPHLRKKSLSVLCKICGRQALLPQSFQIPLCYDRADHALYSGGYSDVWMGEHRGCKVAVKVLRLYTTSNLGKITTVGRSLSFLNVYTKVFITIA